MATWSCKKRFGGFFRAIFISSKALMISLRHHQELRMGIKKRATTRLLRVPTTAHGVPGGNPPVDPPGKAKYKAKPQPRCRRRGATRGDLERRNMSFKIRLTAWEFANLEVMASAAGVTPSAFLRQRAGLSKIQGNPQALAAIAVMAQANHWLSRIAEKLSAGVPGMDVALCLNQLREIRKFLKNLLLQDGGKSC